MKNLFVYLSIGAFLLGVAIGTVIIVPQVITVWILFLALVVGLIWRRKSHAFSAPFLLAVSLSLLFVSLGITRAEIFSWQFNVSPLEAALDQKVDLTGKIVKEPEYRASSVHLYVEVNEDLLLVTADRLGRYSYGDLINVQGVIERPEVFTTDLGRTFNYPGYLLAKGVEYKVSFAKITLLETGLGNPTITSLLQAKNYFIDSIQSIISEPQASLGIGLLLGVKSALGEETEQNFRRTGIIHIVVLSGYNVMLVVAFIMLVFSFFLSIRLRIIAGIIAIIAFALVVGLSATVVRASIMASLLLVAEALGRRYDVLRALLLAGVVMIILNPYLLVYDVGFQLSFLATLGLVLIVPQFEATTVNNKSRLGWRDYLFATIATQIAVLPILLYHIGEVSLIAVLVNMLVLPLVPVAMLLTFATGLLGFVSEPLAMAVGFLASWSLNYILILADWFGALTYAAITVPQFSGWVVLLMYLFIVGAVSYLKFKDSSLKQRRNVNDWIIEEEVTVTQNEKAVTTEVTASQKNLPIFFR